ncbi:MAG: hypothetical protein WC785_08250 [Tatlockia sp.]
MIRSKVAGVIIAMSMMAAAGTSQACADCTTIEGFTGIGWHMVPCGTCIQPAATWQQYVSGGYAPPIVGRGIFVRQ